MSYPTTSNKNGDHHHQNHDTIVAAVETAGPQSLYNRRSTNQLQQQQPEQLGEAKLSIASSSRSGGKRIDDNFKILRKILCLFCVGLIMMSLFYMESSNMTDLSLYYNIAASNAQLFTTSTETTKRVPTSEVISYGPPGWSDVKLAIYISSHFPEHHEVFLPCWNDAVQRMDIFKYADLILFTSTENTTQYTQYLPFRKIIIKKYVNNGYQEGAVQAMINPFLEEVSWFDQYDWVIRLNADVLIKDDKWLIQTMLNPSIDGIFHDCLNRKDFPDRPIIQSDFNAFRPKALDKELILAASQLTAETHLSSAFRNIYDSKKFAWVEGARNSVAGNCRIEGIDSPVVHVHSMATACPYYYNSTLQNVY